MPCTKTASDLRLADVTICGVGGDKIRDFITVLQAHDIASPRQLNERLGKGTPEQRIEVYDTVNEARLLGTLPCPPVKPHGWLNYAVTAPYYDLSRKVPDQHEERLRVSKVSFRVSVKTDGWNAKVVLTTAEPLEQIMLIEDFRLPGESRREALERRYRHRYPKEGA